MTRDLSRLFRPKSIAVLGGGWAANVVEQLLKSGYVGEIWPVNPKRAEILGVPCFPSLDALPGAPDAAFVGVNRELTLEIVVKLRAMGAGGATLFASGFSESDAEGTGGAALQAKLVEAAGEMPILGPNCYGFLNYLDNVTLWPDQHGGEPVGRGVAIVSQSSNIAINMTMQARGLPIAYMAAAGNQAQTGAAAMACALMDDPRVSAAGLYLEGLGDIGALEELAAKSRATGKPVVVLKTGRTESARRAAVTHTASMSGGAAFSSALFARLGMVETGDVETFLELLKLLGQGGPLSGDTVCAVCCSGGEAGLVADTAGDGAIRFRPFGGDTRDRLKALLGPIVTIANPLDYHTFIWGDTPRMAEVFTAVLADAFDLAVFVLDLPRADRCDTAGYRCAVDAILAARAATGARVAVVSLLPENLDEETIAQFAAAGIVTLNGMRSGMAAVAGAIAAGRLAKAAAQAPPLRRHAAAVGQRIADEAESKAWLAGAGVAVPRRVTSSDRAGLAAMADASLAYPLAAKALGIAHKTEAGAVVLDLADRGAVEAALSRLPTAAGYLVEEMATGAIAEIIVGLTREAGGVAMLTIGAGGVLAEIMDDKAHLLLPVREDEVRGALRSLRLWPLLQGYRSRPAASLDALADAILRIAEAASQDVLELDVNPLVAREHDAVAVDALLVFQE